MEIFYSDNIACGNCTLDPEEAQHCIKVLRHRKGDQICIIDGCGTMYECELTCCDARCCSAKVLRSFPLWHSHPYSLTMAVCPTKNNERFEWFVEKATEVGVDVIAPVIGEHSERKVYKCDRARKIALSAAKQSLKALLPRIEEPVSVRDFILSVSDSPAKKLIAYCFEDEKMPRTSIVEALGNSSDVIVLIGPEGDFSTEEARLALENGFVPVHLGSSRLRTETAALTAVEAVYLRSE